MNDNAIRAANVIEANVNDIKEAIAQDNDLVVLQTIKRMKKTLSQLVKTTKDAIKLKKNLAKNEKQTSPIN